jgi:hypothetical protein
VVTIVFCVIKFRKKGSINIQSEVVPGRSSHRPPPQLNDNEHELVTIVSKPSVPADNNEQSSQLPLIDHEREPDHSDADDHLSRTQVDINMVSGSQEDGYTTYPVEYESSQTTKFSETQQIVVDQ